jgi:hypothetical protein
MFLKLVRSITRGKSALPDEVSDVVKAARIVQREGDPETGPRLAISMGGPIRGMFIFSRAEAEKRIRSRWPWLTDNQVNRCVSYLEARVCLAIEPDKAVKRPKWITNY